MMMMCLQPGLSNHLLILFFCFEKRTSVWFSRFSVNELRRDEVIFYPFSNTGVIDIFFKPSCHPMVDDISIPR